MKYFSRYLFPVLFFFWSILLVYLSLMPGSALPKKAFGNFPIRLDYLEHMAVFAIFSALYLFWRYNKLKHQKREILYFLIIGTTYATATELIQHFTPNRTLNPIDIIFNLLGLYTGFFLSLLLCKKYLSIKKAP